LKHYTHSDKRQHLQQFTDSLREAIAAIESSGESKISDAPLKACLARRCGLRRSVYDGADFVAFEGTHLKGRQELASFHRPIFGTVVKGSRLEGEESVCTKALVTAWLD
jgi:hypothetical protein